MKIESIKKHEMSQQHLDAKAPHRAQSHPGHGPMEVALQNMEQEELHLMRMLFNAALWLVEAELPFEIFLLF